jgi:hypothetical protein
LSFVSPTVFIVATWLAAILGGIGIGAAFISAIVGYQLTERALRESDVKIAEANARAKEADLAVQKYKQPRNLDIESFSETLKGVPPAKVQVLYVRECTDCSWVAQFIGSFLNTAKWEAEWGPIDEKAAASGPWRMQPSAISVRGYPWGITVVAKDISQEKLNSPEGASQNALVEALRKSYEGVTMTFDRDLPDDLIRVVVAPKP